MSLFQNNVNQATNIFANHNISNQMQSNRFGSGSKFSIGTTSNQAQKSGIGMFSNQNTSNQFPGNTTSGMFNKGTSNNIAPIPTNSNIMTTPVKNNNGIFGNSQNQAMNTNNHGTGIFSNVANNQAQGISQNGLSSNFMNINQTNSGFNNNQNNQGIFQQNQTAGTGVFQKNTSQPNKTGFPQNNTINNQSSNTGIYGNMQSSTGLFNTNQNSSNNQMGSLNHTSNNNFIQQKGTYHINWKSHQILDKSEKTQANVNFQTISSDSNTGAYSLEELRYDDLNLKKSGNVPPKPQINNTMINNIFPQNYNQQNQNTNNFSRAPSIIDSKISQGPINNNLGPNSDYTLIPTTNQNNSVFPSNNSNLFSQNILNQQNNSLFNQNSQSNLVANSTINYNNPNTQINSNTMNNTQTNSNLFKNPADLSIFNNINSNKETANSSNSFSLFQNIGTNQINQKTDNTIKINSPHKNPTSLFNPISQPTSLFSNPPEGGLFKNLTNQSDPSSMFSTQPASCGTSSPNLMTAPSNILGININSVSESVKKASINSNQSLRDFIYEIENTFKSDDFSNYNRKRPEYQPSYVSNSVDDYYDRFRQPQYRQRKNSNDTSDYDFYQRYQSYNKSYNSSIPSFLNSKRHNSERESNDYNFNRNIIEMSLRVKNSSQIRHTKRETDENSINRKNSDFVDIYNIPNGDSIKSKIIEITIRLKADNINFRLNVNQNNKVSLLENLVIEELKNKHEKYKRLSQENISLIKNNTILKSSKELSEYCMTQSDTILVSIDTDHDEDHYIGGNQNKRRKMKKTLKKNEVAPLEMIPQLTKVGYKTTPDMKEIFRMTLDELKEVKNFKIFNKYGEIEWKSSVDISGLNLDDVITIDHGRIEVYQNMTPIPGKNEKLYKPCVCTLYNIHSDSLDFEKENDRTEFIDFLKSKVTDDKGEFIHYDFKSNSLKFILKEIIKKSK